MNFGSKRNVLMNVVNFWRSVPPPGLHTSCVLSERNFYDVLNVRKNCSSKEIRDSFIDLAKKCHPDATQNDPKSHAKFVELQKAYTVLSSPSKRHEYDTTLHSRSYGHQTQPGGKGPVEKDYYEEFDDEFKEYFYRSRQPPRPYSPERPGAFRVTLLFVAFSFLGALIQFCVLKWLHRRAHAEEMERHQKGTASYYALKEEMDRRKEDYDVRKLREAYFRGAGPGGVGMHLVPTLIRPDIPSIEEIEKIRQRNRIQPPLKKDDINA